MTETLNPIPICEVCGAETVRSRTTAGKGRYQCNNLDCNNRKWYIRGSKKLVEKQLYSDEEREEMLVRTTLSLKKDFDGSRRAYADKVSTSEALRKRAQEGSASQNGHHNELLINRDFSPQMDNEKFN